MALFSSSTCMATEKPQAGILQRATAEHLQLLFRGGTALVGEHGVHTKGNVFF